MPLKEKKKHTKTLEQPLVSIITPLYNAANYIAKTIVSVQQQSHTNWELLIVDDYSTDNGLEIAKSIAKTDSRIHIYSKNLIKAQQYVATKLQRWLGEIILRF